MRRRPSEATETFVILLGTSAYAVDVSFSGPVLHP